MAPNYCIKKDNPIQILTLDLASEAENRLFEVPIAPLNDL